MRFKSLLSSSFVIGSAIAAAAPAMAQTQEGGTLNVQGSIQVCEAARGEHRVRLEQGQRYVINATSDAFDTYLRVFAPGNTETPVAEDDDGGEGLNSRITLTAAESGDYVIRVSSFSPGQTGDYRLSVEPPAPLPALVTRPARTERGQWRLYEGELTATDAMDNARRVDDYQLDLAAGRAAMIHLEAQGFDTYLRVYRLADRGGEPIMQDDDSGGYTNSFLYFAPDEAGTYVVRVTSFGEGETGAYRLRIGEQPLVRPQFMDQMMAPPAPEGAQ